MSRQVESSQGHEFVEVGARAGEGGTTWWCTKCGTLRVEVCGQITFERPMDRHLPARVGGPTQEPACARVTGLDLSAFDVTTTLAHALFGIRDEAARWFEMPRRSHRNRGEQSDEGCGEVIFQGHGETGATSEYNLRFAWTRSPRPAIHPPPGDLTITLDCGTGLRACAPLSVLQPSECHEGVYPSVNSIYERLCGEEHGSSRGYEERVRYPAGYTGEPPAARDARPTVVLPRGGTREQFLDVFADFPESGGGAATVQGQARKVPVEAGHQPTTPTSGSLSGRAHGRPDEK